MHIDVTIVASQEGTPSLILNLCQPQCVHHGFPSYDSRGFTGFRIQNQIKEASHRKGEAEEELQSLANEIILQIIRAYLTRTTNAEQIALEQERVTFSKEALLLAQTRYRLGLSPIVEVVRATAVLFESESRLAEARYIYKTSESVVAYATGQEYKRF